MAKAKTKTEPKADKPPSKTTDKPELSASEKRLQAAKLGIGRMKDAVDKALPRGLGIDADKFLQMAASYITLNAQEQEEGRRIIDCNGQSIQRSVVQAAELGLVLGSALGHCHLIPYAGACTLMVGVWGYVALARRGGVRDVWAEVVYEKDHFEIEMGSERKLVHRPDPFATDRGKVVGAYAVAVLEDGSKSWTIMSRRDLDQARAASKAKNSPAWRDWPDEMFKRSVIKRARKTWPLQIESAAAIAKAIEYDFDSIETTGSEVVAEERRLPGESALDAAVRQARAKPEDEDQRPKTEPEDQSQDPVDEPPPEEIPPEDPDAMPPGEPPPDYDDSAREPGAEG